MPTYDYICEANGRTVEVMHAMSVTLKTWGQVCEEAELDLGDTPPDAPVSKGLGLGVVAPSNTGPGAWRTVRSFLRVPSPLKTAELRQESQLVFLILMLRKATSSP